jgi:hypothetical protein
MFPRIFLPLLLATLAAGCAHSPKIHYDYAADGTPVSYRRLEKNLERDFMHHFGRDVYETAPYGIDRDATEEQRPVLETLGVPDFVRHRFTSLENERVTEWVYLDAMQVFQFVNGNLVFQGSLTDYEQTLLRHGRPSRAATSRSDTGRREDLLIYNKVFQPSLQEFFFIDGKLIQKQEGN